MSGLTDKAKSVSAPRRAPSNSKASSRNDVLDAALKIFARDTFEGASLQEIARIANVGQPLVHYHFGSKENLWRAAIDYALAEFHQFFTIVSSAMADLRPIDEIRVVCRSFLTFCAQRPEHGLIFLNEMRVSGERFDWLVEEYVQPCHRYLDGLIEAAVEQGQIAEIPPVHLTPMIFSVLAQFYSLGPLIKVMYNVDPCDPEVAEKHADFAMRILLKGILAEDFKG